MAREPHPPQEAVPIQNLKSVRNALEATMRQGSLDASIGLLVTPRSVGVGANLLDFCARRSGFTPPRWLRILDGFLAMSDQPKSHEQGANRVTYPCCRFCMRSTPSLRRSCGHSLPPVRLGQRILTLFSSIWAGQMARHVEDIASQFPETFRIEYTKLIVQSIISIILVLASVYILISTSAEASEKHWASGTVGVVLGFWLRAAPVQRPGEASVRTVLSAGP
jgi:hypothetical protein